MADTVDKSFNAAVSSKTPQKVAVIIGLLSAIIWGSSFVATKIALTEATPITVITLRFIIALVVLVPAAMFDSRGQVKITKVDWLLLALVGFDGITFHQLLQVNGLVTAKATDTGWLITLVPVFAIILARIFLREKQPSMRLLGVAVAFLGTLFVVTQGNLSPQTLHLPGTFGDTLIILSAANWAVFSVLSKPLISRYPPTLVVLLTVSFGILFLLPVFILNGGWQDISRIRLNGWIAISLLGIFASGFAYYWWYKALDKLNVSVTNAFIFVEPLVTTITASFILGEVFTWGTLTGALLIAGGVFIIVFFTQPAKVRETNYSHPLPKGDGTIDSSC